MIKYFKELENPSNYYLELPYLNANGPLSGIDIKTLPINFFNKYAILFQKIIEYDLLFDTNDKIPQIYLNSIDEELLIPKEMLFYSFLSNEIKEDGTPFSKNGINKIYFLKQEYYRRHGKKELTNNDYYNYLLLYDNYDENLYDYFLAIYDYMRFSNQLLGASKWQIYYYLLAAKKMAKFQGKLSPEDERLFDEALKEIINYKIIIPDKKPYNVIKYKLFNEWYITPFNHLYNTLSEAHTPNVFNDILRRCGDGYNFYPHKFLGEAKEILEKGCSYLDFRANTHINCTFPGIYTLDIPYFDLDEVDRLLFETSGSTLKYAYKIQNPKIKTITAGILSALAGIIAFSYYLKKNSCDYDKDIIFAMGRNDDDFLVRCCGFHKISSVLDKTITTSCINYEEEFKEYIEKGWHIDFIKPIVFNEYTKRLEEYSDEALLIKTLHL